jgi:hypothetical protein
MSTRTLADHSRLAARKRDLSAFEDLLLRSDTHLPHYVPVGPAQVTLAFPQGTTRATPSRTFTPAPGAPLQPFKPGSQVLFSKLSGLSFATSAPVLAGTTVLIVSRTHPENGTFELMLGGRVLDYYVRDPAIEATAEVVERRQPRYMDLRVFDTTGAQRLPGAQLSSDDAGKLNNFHFKRLLAEEEKGQLAHQEGNTLYQDLDPKSTGSVSMERLQDFAELTPGRLRSVLLPSMGHQLLPSQNTQWVHSLAPLYLLLQACFAPYLWGALGLPKVMSLRERLLVVRERPQAEGNFEAPDIRTIVLAAPSSDMTYNAGQHQMAVFRARAILALLGAVAINLVGWVAVLGWSFLPSEGSPSPARQAAGILSWAMDLIVLMVQALTQQRPSYMGFAIVMMFVGVICVVAFVLRVLEKLPIVLPYSGTGEGDLPAVMPLLLDVKNTPFAMVSYAWGSTPLDKDFAQTARALAAALPNCWCDVQMMSSGTVVPAVTAQVARTAHLLVMVITPAYLRSRNCSIELMAAVLYRRSYHQTWAYLAGTVPPAVEDFLRDNLGIKVYRSITDLLKDAGQKVYRIERSESSPIQAESLMNWFSVYSEARESVSRNFRLPTPMVRKGRFYACSSRRITPDDDLLRMTAVSVGGGEGGSQSMAAVARPSILKPRGAVSVAGLYLAADALAVGECVVLVAEQVLLVAALVSMAIVYLLMRYGYLYNVPIAGVFPQDVPLSTWLLFPIFVGIMMVLAVVVILPFALNVDVRTHHSSLLRPLCAAAFIQSFTDKGKGGGDATAAADSSTTGAADPPSRPTVGGTMTFLFAVGKRVEGKGHDPLLEHKINNVITFMRRIGGEGFAKRVAYGKDVEDPKELAKDFTGLCVCVFVLRSPEDVQYWLKMHCGGGFPLSNTILVVEEGAKMQKVQDKDAMEPVNVVVQGKILRLNDYIYLDMGVINKGEVGAYTGFAPMLLDNIGAKIGSAYLSALRRHAELEQQSSTQGERV